MIRVLECSTFGVIPKQNAYTSLESQYRHRPSDDGRGRLLGASVWLVYSLADIPNSLPCNFWQLTIKLASPHNKLIGNMMARYDGDDGHDHRHRCFAERHYQ